MYALFSCGQLVYIGSAVNLRDRFSDHGLRRRQLRGPGRFSRLPQLHARIALSRRPGDWLAREYRLIRRLRPQLNQLHRGAGRRRTSHRPSAADRS